MITLSMGARETIHFNSDDLENGNVDKGLSAGSGRGQGDWRLKFESDLDIDVLTYIRTSDGFLTAIHDAAPIEDSRYQVATFNPASNLDQVSSLRLMNPGMEDAEVTITGVDDAGASPGTVVHVAVPAGASVALTASHLESGAGVDGALGRRCRQVASGSGLHTANHRNEPVVEPDRAPDQPFDGCTSP